MHTAYITDEDLYANSSMPALGYSTVERQDNQYYSNILATL